MACLDVAGAVQVLPGFAMQAVPLLQSGEAAEVVDGFSGFRAVAVMDSDGSLKSFNGPRVPVRRRQNASCPAQVSGQPDVSGPERFFRRRPHLLAIGDRSCRVTRRHGLIGEPAQLS